MRRLHGKSWILQWPEKCSTLSPRAIQIETMHCRFSPVKNRQILDRPLFISFIFFPAANLQTSPNVPFGHIFWRATLKMPLRLFTKEPNGKILEDLFQYFQSCIFPSGIETLEMAERGGAPQGEDLTERNYLPITIFLLQKLPNNIKTYLLKWHK